MTSDSPLIVKLPHVEHKTPAQDISDVFDPQNIKLENSFQSVFKLNSLSTNSSGLELGEVAHDEYKIVNEDLNDNIIHNQNGPNKKLKLPPKSTKKSEPNITLPLPDDFSGHDDSAIMQSNQIEQFNQVIKVKQCNFTYYDVTVNSCH